MAYDLAPSLKQFRAEVNATWPQRDKTSDGWIGDTSHQARPSDHNPGARDLVHAFDTDEDLDGNRGDTGADAWPIVDRIIRNRDSRVKYLIYEGQIISGRLGPQPWVWRDYDGVNAHKHHVHLSILSTVEAEQDTSPWLVVKQGGEVPKEDSLSAQEVAQIKGFIDDTRPYFAKDASLAAVWIVYKDNGTKRWVQNDTMWRAAQADRVFSNGIGGDGLAVPWPRSKAHLDTYETVGPVPPGW